MTRIATILNFEIIIIFTVYPFGLDSQISFNALCKLEESGISLSANIHTTELMTAAGFTLDQDSKQQIEKSDWSPCEYLQILIGQWKSDKNSRLPPTWMSLLEVLREQNLKELSQQIEDCISGEY